MTKAGRLALYAMTFLVFLAMTPVRFWLNGQLGAYKSPDISPGMSVEDLQAFLDAMAKPLAGATGSYWFKALHTFTLDLALPVLLGSAIVVFLLQTARRLPRFAALNSNVQRLVAAMLALPYVAFDYRENFRVWQLIEGKALLDEDFAGSLATLTLLKFSSLALAATVCLTLWLATLKAGTKR